jgi:hypothetical protein
MNLPIPTLVALLLAVTPAIAGCAGEDAEAQEAAYPPIGYTPPGEAPASQAGAPAAAAAATRGAPASRTLGPSGGEVAIGDDETPPPPEEAAPDGPPPGDGAGDGYADNDPAALSDFRSTLDPYGNWQDDPNYGTVWVPSESVVGDDFTPYVSDGHWAYDNDYVWESDYSWGWAPFHYGRWVYASGPGWEWIPGRTYAGAWVSWRYGVGDWGYVGWAPLAPTWCWRGGVAVGLGYVPRAPYAFVGTGELFHPQVGGRVIAGPRGAEVAVHTQPYASPSAGRVAAHPSVGGPSPTNDLHIAPDQVTRATGSERGLAQARAYSRPSSAVALGARAPAGSAYALRGSSAPRSTYWTGSRTLGATPVVRGDTASHFGGRLGGGFAGSAASAPPMRAPAVAYGGNRGYSMPARYAGPSASYRGPSTVRSGPSYSARPSSFSGASRGASGGASHSFSGGGFHGGSGGFHGGGGGHSGGGHR